MLTSRLLYKKMSLYCLYLSFLTPTVFGMAVLNAPFYDPSYLPVANLNGAFRGYNLYTGNPNSQYFLDNGHRSQIFETTEMDGKGRIRVHSSIDTIRSLKCRGSNSESVITSMKQYRKDMLKSTVMGDSWQLGSATKISGGVNAGGAQINIEKEIEPFIQAGNSDTLAANDLKSFFRKERGVIVQLKATCSLDSIWIHSHNLPPFRQNFIENVKHLYYAQKNLRKSEFRQFIFNFGTHFSEQTVMGAKLIYSRRFTASESQFMDKQKIIECTKKFAKFSFFASYSTNNSNCDTNSGGNETMDSKFLTREDIWTDGSKPYKDFSTWANQEFDNTIPISMRLTPILALFTEENLYKIDKNIDASHFISWFTPMFLNLCEIMNYGCDSREEGICGISDDCAFGEQCMQTKIDGYTCKRSKAKLYWRTEYTFAYKIIVYNLDGRKILNFTQPQSECNEKFCNITIENLNLNQKYIFDVSKAEIQNPWWPSAKGANEWTKWTIRRTASWYRIPGATKYVINIVDTKTGDVLVKHRGQCDKKTNKCSLLFAANLKVVYEIYILVFIEDSYILEKSILDELSKICTCYDTHCMCKAFV